MVVLLGACWVWLRGTCLGWSFREEARGDEQLLLPIFSDLDPGVRGGISKRTVKYMVRYRMCMDIKGLVLLSEPLVTKSQHLAIASHSNSHNHGSL